MNTDIRLSVKFFPHPKTVKLEHQLGLPRGLASYAMAVDSAKSAHRAKPVNNSYNKILLSINAQ
ncbi:hypothetical protein DSECCO2_173250 [anaerobic digester metagenome]